MTWRDCFVIFDPGDRTYHLGAGQWGPPGGLVEPYNTEAEARRVIAEDLDPAHTLKLEVQPARHWQDEAGGWAVSVQADLWRLRFESEQALTRRLVAEYSASRAGIMALQGELHEHLALMVRYLEEETSAGDGIREDHFDGYVAAKSLLVRAAVDGPCWENARAEVASLLRRASEVPGLSATLDETRADLDRAVGLLSMLDRAESRHPDVAAFLDELAERAVKGGT